MRTNEFIYAFDEKKQLVNRWKMYAEEVCTKYERIVANDMLKDPTVKRVYKADMSATLARAFRDAVATNDHADWILFEDLCRTEGILIAERE